MPMKTMTRLALAAAFVAAAAAACSSATEPKFPTDGDIDESNPKGGNGGAYVAPATAPTAFYV
jgi:hypothetical protein